MREWRVRRRDRALTLVPVLSTTTSSVATARLMTPGTKARALVALILEMETVLAATRKGQSSISLTRIQVTIPLLSVLSSLR